MHRRTLLSLIVCWMSLPLGAAAAAAAEPASGNLVPDPAFKQADFGVLPKKTSWRDHQIVLPGEAKVDKQTGAVTLTGGKVFLHSSVFDVAGGTQYRVSLKAQGSGKISVECLWWAKYNRGPMMASPHRTVAVKPVAVDKQGKPVVGSSPAPKDATKAYIRIVVEGGTATISEPKVAAAKK